MFCYTAATITHVSDMHIYLMAKISGLFRHSILSFSRNNFLVDALAESVGCQGGKRSRSFGRVTRAITHSICPSWRVTKKTWGNARFAPGWLAPSAAPVAGKLFFFFLPQDGILTCDEIVFDASQKAPDQYEHQSHAYDVVAFRYGSSSRPLGLPQIRETAAHHN